MPILQIGRNEEEGYFFYVMELADDANQTRTEPNTISVESGTSRPPPINPESFLPKTLASEKLSRGRIEVGECVHIGALLTAALDHLHRHGLIHRDIKPSNIVFVKGLPKLADIGLVAGLAEAESYVGTEGFIPPEGPNSAQADIYSLGKVLYEVAMGKDRQDFPEPCSELGEAGKLLVELNLIILKACHPDRNKRYRCAREMLDDLEMLLEGKSVRAKQTRRRRMRLLAAIAASTGLLTLAAFGFDQLLDWRVRLIQGESSGINPALLSKVPTRDRLAPAETIDLSPFYTAALTEPWYSGPAENTLSALPRGLQILANTKFDVRGLVQINGGEISAYGADKYPREIRGIPVGRWVKRLYFLEGALSEVMDGKQIGAYQVQYRSGRTAQIPLVYGREVRALWQPLDSPEVNGNSVVAWTGQNLATRERQMALRIYKQIWENPWPADEVIALTFTSNNANSAPFLVALTCDEEAAAANRKASTPSLAATLQARADSFQRLNPLSASAPFQFSRMTLNEHPAEIAGKFYDGFRFTAPSDAGTDLVWSFMAATNVVIREWYILPAKGWMKVGFEDWHHGLVKGSDGAAADLHLQFLNGKKLKPGKEYFIWFAFEQAQPVEVQSALRFLPSGELDNNKAETLARGLGMAGEPALAEIKFHRHYCLGAVR
jgi:hypothetical protein